MNENKLLSYIRKYQTIAAFLLVLILAVIYLALEWDTNLWHTLEKLIIAIIPEFISVLIALLIVTFGISSYQSLKESHEKDTFQESVANEFRGLSAILQDQRNMLTNILQVQSQLESPYEFSENFNGHLSDNWLFNGNWEIERADGQSCYLIVTDSEIGGIAKPCFSWTDYKFEFDTKIVNSNSSWIIRAKDNLNYVMLQCTPTKINPHFRSNLLWCWNEPVKLPFVLPLNTWFHVQITVRGTRVIVTLTLNGDVREVFNEDLLKPPIKPKKCNNQIQENADLQLYLSYIYGSVGFRESQGEVAHYRNVKVSKL